MVYGTQIAIVGENNDSWAGEHNFNNYGLWYL